MKRELNKWNVLKTIVVLLVATFSLTACSEKGSTADESSKSKLGENKQVISEKVSAIKMAEEDYGDAQIFGIWLGEEGTILNVVGAKNHFKLIAQFVSKEEVAKESQKDRVRPLAQQVITGYDSDFSYAASYPFGKEFEVNDLEVQLNSSFLSELPKLGGKTPDGASVIVIPKGEDYVVFLLMGDNAEVNGSTMDANIYYLLAGTYQPEKPK
ncbi:hypothetical protein [Enterococcus hulanensis]|uniref:hypothetical protein n=1 Tax=Enterococcus hulanensis TaxID=2559929 RepID=UPI0010F89FE3|nr:hypothetical protein [Enterococcus hulanensis]